MNKGTGEGKGKSEGSTLAVWRRRPLASDPLMLTIESLVPVRGHVVNATRGDTVAHLKQVYLDRLLQDSYDRALAAAASGAPPTRRSSFRSEGGVSFATHVRLIFDGHELADETLLGAIAGLTEGSRLVAIAQKEKRGLCSTLVRSLVRWWPLIAVVVLATAFILEVTGSLPGVHPDSVWKCDRPLVAYLIVCAVIVLPYGLILSGLYQEDRGHRLLWFMQSKPLARMMYGSTLMVFVWCIVG